MLKIGDFQKFLGVDMKTTIHKQKYSSNYYFENTVFQTCFESFIYIYIYIYIYMHTHTETHTYKDAHIHVF